MKDKEQEINKILFITLSNIGDVIMSLPALDYLRKSFPQAQITVMTGPRPKEIFENNPHIAQVVVFDKHSRLRQKIKLFYKFKKENFDLVVDLRNSFFGLFLPARYRSSAFLKIPKEAVHMRSRHMYKVRKQKIAAFIPPAQQRVSQDSKLKIEDFMNQAYSLYIRSEDRDYINSILEENNIRDEDKIIVVSSGARSHIKRWGKEKFAELLSLLVKELAVKIILIGDKDDLPVNKYIAENARYPVLDLTNKTSLSQAAYLLKKAKLLITNDSAMLHLGSYCDIPTLAIFGPTNEAKYGPWSQVCYVIKKDISCRPCEKAQCKFHSLDCMRLIKTEDVLKIAKKILTASYDFRDNTVSNSYKRILVVRTDRIGDVLLSTPVIQTLRNYYPQAYIAMMVSPYAKDIVDGNPYLDEVIVYDKDNKHKNWWRSFKFSRYLAKKKFDLAIVLHPINRAHVITFFAGIPKRIGYNYKMGFLLTHKIEHRKYLGEKHESEYNFDLLKPLGITQEEKKLFMPIKRESEEWLDKLFKEEGIQKNDKLLILNPAASCASKVWPAERYAKVADQLITKYGFKVFIICGPKDIALASDVVSGMKNTAINLAGRTSVSQLASLLKRSSLFISNDSGPVHIACAVGTPVISIFGRNQKGLGPQRWGPLGEKKCILHKEVGCVECLAHNCKKGFLCLRAITVEDVLKAADSLNCC